MLQNFFTIAIQNDFCVAVVGDCIALFDLHYYQFQQTISSE